MFSTRLRPSPSVTACLMLNFFLNISHSRTFPKEITREAHDNLMNVQAGSDWLFALETEAGG